MRDPEEKILKTDKAWMTKAEMRSFDTALKTGRISFFKIAYCQKCKKEIPATESKLYCSEDCYKKDGNVDKESLAHKDEDDQW